MKRILSTLISLMLVLAVHSQVVQQGIVQEYKGKASKTPLAGVELNVRSAGSAVSDKSGSFSLNFNTLKAGERVNVRRIEKDGYEIFNKEALEQWNINPSRPFVVVMCRSDKLRKLKDNYHRISSASYARQLKKEEDAIAALKRDGKLKQEEYDRKLAELHEEYERQLDNLDSYIDRFSRIDLSELNDAEQKIIEMLADGKLNEAIEAYEKIDFIGSYRTEVEQRKELEKNVARLGDAIDTKKKETKALRQSVFRQIDALRLAGGKENYERIGILLRQMADADTTDTSVALEFATFASSHNQHDLATEYMARVLEYGSPKEQYLARVSLNLFSLLATQLDEQTLFGLLGALDSRYCQENPAIRVAILSSILLTDLQLNILDEEDVGKYLHYIESFSPKSEIEWQTKILASSALTQFNKYKKVYSTNGEYLQDLRNVLDLAAGYEREYGYSEIVAKLALATGEDFLGILLSCREFELFDSYFGKLSEYAGTLFRQDPVQYLPTFKSISLSGVSRPIIQSDDEGFSSAYSAYLESIKKSGLVDDEQLKGLLAECIQFVISKGQNGFGDPRLPADVFYTVFPPDAFTATPHFELVGTMEYILLGASPADRLAKTGRLIDAYLTADPSLKMPRAVKGELLLIDGDEDGAKKELDFLMKSYPEDDVSFMNIYVHFYGGE